MTWLVALAGVFLGRDRRKKFWLLVLLVFPLLMLGPGGGLHPLLSFLLPVTRFMRHSSQYVLFVFFAILYFFVLGANWLLEQRKVSVKWNWVAATATVFTLLGVYAFKWDPRTYVWVAPALVSCFIFAWWNRNRVGAVSLWIGCCMAHLLAVCFWVGDRSAFVQYIALFLVIPAMAFCLAQRLSGGLRILGFAIVLLSLFGDLMFHMHRFRGYFSRVPPSRSVQSNF